MARLANSQIISPTNQLHPLYGISTALQIPHFPQSPEALADLDGKSPSKVPCTKSYGDVLNPRQMPQSALFSEPSAPILLAELR
jgi:hypothetical protein